MLGNVKTLPCRLQFVESEHATVGYMHCFEESYRQNVALCYVFSFLMFILFSGFPVFFSAARIKYCRMKMNDGHGSKL